MVYICFCGCILVRVNCLLDLWGVSREETQPMSTRMARYTTKVSLLVSTFMFLTGAVLMAQNDTVGSRDLDAIGPAFEVATIRPANRDDGRNWFGIRPDASGRFQASAVPLSMLVSVAYFAAPNKSKVTTGRATPSWVSSDQFDIQAKIDGAYMSGWSKLSGEQRMNVIRPMIRRLLAERFRVKLGIETRMTPVYALLQAKGGAHVREVAPPAPGDGDPAEVESRWMAENPGKASPGTIMCSGDKCTGHAVKISNAVGQIAVNSRADRMVIDQTGLKGYYDLSFRFPREKDEFPMQAVGDDLGMKFQPRSIPIKTYVIESAEKPSVDGAEIGQPAAGVR